MRIIPICFLLLLGCSAQADVKFDLVRSIEEAGSNDYKDERHSVEVNGCQMTTYRWRDMPDHGWVLWSSFQFDMIDAVLSTNKETQKERYLYALLDAGPPEIGYAIIPFETRDETFARFERSVLRPTKKEKTPSPRGDGTTHYYIDSDSFFVGMQGPGVADKAARFTEGFAQYVAAYCTFSS